MRLAFMGDGDERGELENLAEGCVLSLRDSRSRSVSSKFGRFIAMTIKGTRYDWSKIISLR